MKKSRYIDPNPEQLKISFVAPSGYGKTTAAEYLKLTIGSINLKLAAPLYDIQDYYYKVLHIQAGGKQDGEFLQFLGDKIQRERPYFLADTFYEALCQNKNRTSILTNDDCRPHNYAFLKSMGFVFVRINGVSRTREDITEIQKNHCVEWQREIPCDYVLDNNGTLEEYKNKIQGLVGKIAAQYQNKKMLCYSNREKM